MEKEELQLELKNMAEKLEGKTKKDMQESLKEFGDKLASKSDLATKSQQEAFDQKLSDFSNKLGIEMKGKIEDVETKNAKIIEEQQSHIDKLDAKMKGGKHKMEAKGFNEILAEEFSTKEQEIQDFIEKKSSRVSLEIKAPGDMSTGSVTGGNRYGQLFAPRIIESPRRKVHIADIVPGGSIGAGNSFTFMREVARGEGNPAPTAESVIKPQFDFDLEESTVQVENIAGWLRVTNKSLRNIPGFLSFLQSRIPERFMRVMDAQMLYGTGVSPNLKGILDAGNFQASASALANPLIEKLIDDVALLEDTFERDANGVLIRPVDYYGFFKNKATGSGEYDLPRGVTFEGGILRLFGIPVFASTAVTSPDYVVGDWANGAQLLTQEAMKIEFFREDGDNVRTNRVTVRVEGDFAMPVYGPDYFIKGTTAQA